ncbi:MAG: tRNA (N6-threonylcarbamoyladenosine(37)-N6)-methyltransferase TrmO [Enterobacteriaceae bacterium]
MSDFLFHPVGVILSPYKEKFAVPRQPGLVKEGKGELQLLPPYNQADMVRDLQQFSHIWLLSVFHHTMQQGWHPTVRPPRLGGNRRTGLFASRSPFRPNPIALSLVELLAVRCQGGETFLELGSLDLVDGTPVLDIKPYLPYAESIPHARAGFATQAPEPVMPVTFTAQAQQQLQQYQSHYPSLSLFISEVLAQDPRPAYHNKEDSQREYAVHLLEFNIRWRVIGQQAEVFAVELL